MMTPIGVVPVQIEFINKASPSLKKKKKLFFFFLFFILIKTLSTPVVTLC